VSRPGIRDHAVDAWNIAIDLPEPFIKPTLRRQQ
jgi:hypothetical protein